MTNVATLWAADPHQYGPGKVHMIDPENTTKTYCGRFTAAIPGKPTSAGKATCQICLQGPFRREEYKREQAKWAEERKRWEAQERERQIIREREWAQKRAAYHEYLESDEWKSRCALVHKRAGHVCEGCGTARSVQVHHLTYAHVGDEFLWELKAVCRACHERFHEVGTR